MEFHTSLILQHSVSCSSFATTLLAAGVRPFSRVQAFGSDFKSIATFTTSGSSFQQMGTSPKRQFSISRAVGSVLASCIRNWCIFSLICQFFIEYASFLCTICFWQLNLLVFQFSYACSENPRKSCKMIDVADIKACV